VKQVSYIEEECRLRLLKKMILRRISGSKRDENGEWRRLTMRNFTVFTVHLIQSE
jgi:hypothetical protein